MLGLSPTELIIIVAIVSLIFGSSQIPKLARSLGEAKRELENASKTDDKPRDN